MSDDAQTRSLKKMVRSIENLRVELESLGVVSQAQKWERLTKRLHQIAALVEGVVSLQCDGTEVTPWMAAVDDKAVAADWFETPEEALDALEAYLDARAGTS